MRNQYAQSRMIIEDRDGPRVACRWCVGRVGLPLTEV